MRVPVENRRRERQENWMTFRIFSRCYGLWYVQPTGGLVSLENLRVQRGD